MAATDRYQLSLEATSRGTQEVEKLIDLLNRVATAQDRAAKKSTEIAGTTGKAGDQATVSFERLGDTVESAVINPMGTAIGVARGLATSLGPVGIGLFAIGSAATAAAYHIDQLAEKHTNAAIRLGVTIKEYGLFDQAAKNAGLSGEELVGTMRGLSKALADNSEEGSKGSRALASIGVSARGAFGEVRPMRDLLLDIADKLGDISSPAERAEKAIAILGRGGMSVLPIMNRNLRGTLGELEKLGVGFDDVSAKQAQRFGDALDRVTNKLGVLMKMAGGQSARTLLFLFGDPKTRREQVEENKANEQRARESEKDLAAIQRGERLALTQEQLAAATQAKTIPAMSRVSIEQLTAQLTQSRRQTIQAILDTPQERLERERENLKRAIDEANVEQVRASRARIAVLEEEIKLTEKLKSLQAPGLFIATKFGPEPNTAARQTPRLLRAGEQLSTPALVVQEAEIAKANSQAVSANIDQLNARWSGFTARMSTDRQRDLDAIQRTVDYQSRLVELIAGPSGEVAAVKMITELRLRALDEQLAKGANIHDLEIKRADVLQERTLRLLELERQREEQVRQNAGQLFDALVSRGRTGILEFAQGQLLNIERTIFTNVAGEIGKNATGRLSLPGTQNSDGSLSFLGRILQGTPFGAAPEKVQLDAAQIQLKAASIQLAAAGGGAGLAGVSLPGGVFQGGTGLIMSALGGSTRQGQIAAIGEWLYGGGGSGKGNSTLDLSGYFGGFGAKAQPGFFDQYGSKGATAAVYGGAALASGYGIYSGIKEGGGRGALTAISSGLGAAAAIDPEPISKAILAAAASAAVGIRMLLGDPKKQRETAINELLRGSEFTDAEAVSSTIGFGGEQLDQDYMGGYRLMPRQTIQVTINALDSQNIIDRQEDIGLALKAAVRASSSVVDELRQAILS